MATLQYDGSDGELTRQDQPEEGDVEMRPRRRPGRPIVHEGEPETRGHILAKARRLFMQRGYASVSVGEVAEAVGVTKPTLYYHFGDKEGLYAEVLRDLMREIGGYVRQVTETEHLVRLRLYELALGYFLHANATMEPMLRDTTELLGTERAASVWEAYEREMLTPIRGLMREGMRRGEMREEDPEMLTRAFLSLLDGFTAPGGRGARDENGHRHAAKMVVTLFLDGAAPRE
jgi:AcrR family transcriptional regulator